jgi:cbb3-type cytochrome oxidase maturation protein
MDGFLILILISMGVAGLYAAAMLWSLANGQYDDPDGAKHRILMGDDDRPG